jgi:hypothetical protein
MGDFFAGSRETGSVLNNCGYVKAGYSCYAMQECFHFWGSSLIGTALQNIEEFKCPE